MHQFYVHIFDSENPCIRWCWMKQIHFTGEAWILKCLSVNKLKETPWWGSSSQEDAVFGTVRPDHPRLVLGREETQQPDVTQTPGDAAMAGADTGRSGAQGDTPALIYLPSAMTASVLSEHIHVTVWWLHPKVFSECDLQLVSRQYWHFFFLFPFPAEIKNSLTI